MAAFAACEIDNVLVESSGPELLAMDGSALPFVLPDRVRRPWEQDRPAMRLEVLRPVSVSSAGRAGARARPRPRAGRRSRGAGIPAGTVSVPF